MTLYRTDEILQLCNGSPRFCEFDFSVLSIDDYTGLFNGLPNIVYKKVDSLKFSIDHKDRMDSNHIDDSDSRLLYENSILYNRHRYNHYLYKILSNMVPRSKQLRSLSISRIQLPEKYRSDFFQGCSVCATLREIQLEHVSIENEGLKLALQKFSPFKFVKIVFRDCKITDDVYEDIKDYLKVENRAKRWLLETFDLAENLFSDDELRNILNLLRDQVKYQLTSQAVLPPMLSESQSNKAEEEEEEEFEEDLEEEDEEEEYQTITHSSVRESFNSGYSNRSRSTRNSKSSNRLSYTRESDLDNSSSKFAPNRTTSSHASKASHHSSRHSTATRSSHSKSGARQ